MAEIENCKTRSRAGGNRLRRRIAGKRGAALVELSLVIGLLVLILLGIMDFGYVFFVQHNMVNAARDAAREVTVRDGSSGQGINVAKDRLKGIPLKFKIDVTMPDTKANPNARDVTVAITTPLKEASFGLITGELRANATMRIEESPK